MNAVAPGSRLLARYELCARVEDRGLGESWAALDRQQTDRSVGVKLLRPVPAGDAMPGDLAAMLKNLRVFRNPLSPAIVNQGVVNGRPFIVHEAVRGESVGTRLDRLRAQGRVEDLAVMRAIFDPVAALIESAHRGALPLIHGTLTPGSVIVSERTDGAREVKVLDLGVAPFADPPTDEPARSARRLVTPAPEQFHGGVVTARTDVFSLGALLREFLALPAPEGMTMSPVGVERQRPDVPSAVWAVIAQAMAVDPDARHESVTALRAALAEAWEKPVTTRPSEAVKATAGGAGSLLETVGPTPVQALREAPSLGALVERAMSPQPEPAVRAGPVFQLPDLPATPQAAQEPVVAAPPVVPVVAPPAAPAVDPRAWDPSAMYGSDRGKLLKDVPGPSAPGAPVDAAGMLAKMRARAAPTAGMEAFPAPSPAPVYDETVVAQPHAPHTPNPAPVYDETVVAQPPTRSNAPVMNYAQPPPQQVYAAPPVYAPQSMATPPAPPRASSNAGVWIGVIAGLLIGGTAFFALVFWR